MVVLTKTEYAPGESGEIEAKFSFGGRTGIDRVQYERGQVVTAAVLSKRQILDAQVSFRPT